MGEWNGFHYNIFTYPARMMLTLRFHYTGTGERTLRATGIDFDNDTFEALGTCSTAEDGSISVTWTIFYPGDNNVYYTGRLDDEFTISGRFAYRPEGVANSHDGFILKKVPAEYMIFRPPPVVLCSSVLDHSSIDDELDAHAKNTRRTRALWRYAIFATLNDVRRQRWSWAYFAARRDARKGWMSAARFQFTRVGVDCGPAEVQAIHARARNAFTSRDARYYESLYAYLDDMTTFHECVPSMQPLSSRTGG